MTKYIKAGIKSAETSCRATLAFFLLSKTVDLRRRLSDWPEQFEIGAFFMEDLLILAGLMLNNLTLG